MPRRAPGDAVVRDSGAGLWNGMADGILDEEDFTQSGRLRPSIDGNLPPASPTNWAADMQRTTPFGRQQPPFSPVVSTNSPYVSPQVTPAPTPTRPPPAPVRVDEPVLRRTPRAPMTPLSGSDENIAALRRAQAEVRVVKADLHLEEEKRPGQATREGMLRRFISLAREVETVLDEESR